MKIKELKLPKNYLKRKQSDRCCRKVHTTGTGYFNRNINRCGRLATFEVDGIKFCKQHAGEAALHHVLYNKG